MSDQNMMDVNLKNLTHSDTTETITQPWAFSSPIQLKEITNPLVQNITHNLLTANSGTLTPGQLATGCVGFSPTADASWTFPQGSDFDSTINNPNVGRGVKGIKLLNISLFNVLFFTNTNMAFDFTTRSGILLLGPQSELDIDIMKVGSPNSYQVSGGCGITSVKSTSNLQVSTVANNTYIIGRMFGTGTVTAISAKCRSGSATATLAISGVNITVTASSVSTSGSSNTPTANNNFVAGDYLTATISANSSCLDMCLDVDLTVDQRF